MGLLHALCGCIAVLLPWLCCTVRVGLLWEWQEIAAVRLLWDRCGKTVIAVVLLWDCCAIAVGLLWPCCGITAIVLWDCRCITV